MNDLLAPALFALLVAALVSLAALAARLLTPGGAAAATVVGAPAVLAGTEWVAMLLFFFVSSSALSRLGAGVKEARIGSIIDRGSRRDSVQVLSNGAVFAAAALGALLGDYSAWSAVGAGAIAAATADTWSTELGTLWGGTPRHILTGAPAPPGTSGGITLVGSIAALGGTLAVAAMLRVVQLGVGFLAVVAGGIAGAFADSLLGAAVQERRWCPICAAATERRVHTCGTITDVAGGVPGYDNDAVNLTSIGIGAVVTWMLS